MPILLCVIVLLLCTLSIDAEERPTPLSPVVVRGTPLPSEAIPDRLRSEEGARREIERVPGGAEVVGSKEIEESRASNLKDVLDFVPGVMIRQRQYRPHRGLCAVQYPPRVHL